MIAYLPYVVILALFALFAWRERQHDQERRELYSRVMAQSLAEFKALGGDNEPDDPAMPRNFIRAGLRQTMREIDKEAGD